MKFSVVPFLLEEMVKRFKQECGVLVDSIKHEYDLLPIKWPLQKGVLISEKHLQAHEIKLLWEVSRDEVEMIKPLIIALSIGETLVGDRRMVMLRFFEKMRNTLRVRAKRASELRKAMIGTNDRAQTK